MRPCLWKCDLCRTHWASPGWRVNEHGISVEWDLPRNSRNTKQRICSNAPLSTLDDTCTVLWKNPGLRRENLPLIHLSFQMKNLHYVSNPTNSLVAKYLPGWNNAFIAARRDHICCQIRICHVKMLSQPFLNQNKYNWRVQRCASPQPYTLYKNVHRVIVNTYV